MDVPLLLCPSSLLLAAARTAPPMSARQIALILLIAGLSFFMLIVTRRRLREARNSPRTYVREQMSRLRDEEEVVQDVQEAMAQLEQIAREVQARIDTRFAKLEAVIRHADDRIARLERLLRDAPTPPSLDVTIDDEAASGGGDSHGRRGTSPPSPALGPTAADADKSDADRRLIHTLADAGRTPVQIAEETSRSTGEIELILALRKTAAAARS